MDVNWLEISIGVAIDLILIFGLLYFYDNYYNDD